MTPLTIYLASTSPRRLELLRALGFEPSTVEHGCEEEVLPGEGPEAMVRRLAVEKGRAAAARIAAGAPGVLVAADTTVALGDRTLGKPASADEALEMLRQLSGREHVVLTGLYVARTDDRRNTTAVQVTRVRFRPLAESVLRAYVATGEPLDKAGAYGIQGRGALFVEAIEGSWSNVVGLPVELLSTCFEQVGMDLDELLSGRLVGR